MLYRIQSLIIILYCAYLSACNLSHTQDLNTYVQEVKSRKSAVEDANIEFPAYQSYAYVSVNLRDPFSLNIGPVDPSADRGSCNVTKHTSGVLERYPLDSLFFVGNIQRSDGEQWALIKSKDGIVFRTKKGDYIGPNNGRILRISIDQIELNELIPGIDGCIEKRTTLTHRD